MKKVGFIPLRKGSKGIPGKNKRLLAGKPLFLWVLEAALTSDLDEVYIYTDDEEILAVIETKYATNKKVKAVKRSAESTTDTASTELAILEFCDSINYHFDLFCLLQATSPFTMKTDINSCLEKLKEGYDSALTVVRTHRFIWNEDGTPINYNFLKRPRRQDFNGLLVENGAVYTTTKTSLQQTKNRLGGKIGLVEMPEDSLLEIDTLADWIAVEQLLLHREKNKNNGL